MILNSNWLIHSFLLRLQCMILINYDKACKNYTYFIFTLKHLNIWVRLKATKAENDDFE